MTPLPFKPVLEERFIVGRAALGARCVIDTASNGRIVAYHKADEFGTAEEHAQADAERRDLLAFFREAKAS